MGTKDNIHAGHRQRLREFIDATGVYNLSDLHFLESVLQFVRPRVDTNPIAHALLKEFKTIDNIFDAPEDSLTKVNGVGRQTARFLNMMSAASYLYAKAKALKRPYVGTIYTAVNFLQDIIPPSKNEQFIILICNKNLEVKNYKIIKGISHSFINFDAKELTEYLVAQKTSFCLLAHTHPDHTATPSKDDVEMLDKISPLLRAMSISLIDNMVLGENDFYSCRSSRLFDYNSVDCDISYSKLDNKLDKMNVGKMGQHSGTN